MTLSYCVTTVIFSLNRGQSQTIDSGSSHYSTLFKEHPHNTRLKCPTAVSRTRLKTHTFPDDSSSVVVSGWSPATPHERGTPDSLCPSHGAHQAPLQNRTALFNIASIFCLSMLFSKNSRRFLPDPFEKNTSQHPTTLSHSQGKSQ